MKKIFLIVTLLLVICLIPAVAEVRGNGLFEVDISPDAALISDKAISAEGGVSGVILDCSPVLYSELEPYNNSGVVLPKVQPKTLTDFNCKRFSGWSSINYHLRL